MNSRFIKRLFSQKAGERWVVTGYIGMMLLLAFATFAATAWGEKAVEEQIYHSWWFTAWWALLSVALWLAVYQWIKVRIQRRSEAKRVKWSVIHLHIAFLCILVGAAITSITAKRGFVYLEPGLKVNLYLDKANHCQHQFPFTLQLDSFRIRYDAESQSHADYVSYLHIDQTPVKVAMNHVAHYQGFRFIPYSFDEAHEGSWLSVSHDPWGIGISYLGYLWLTLSFLTLLRRQLFWVGLALLSGFILQQYAESTPLMPVLRSAWLGVHVSFIVLAYSLFLILCVNGVMGLCMHRQSERLMRQSLGMLRVAEALLGIGIFMGAVWANQSWGRYWAWDPKEVWALITFMLYAMPLHHHRLRWLSSPRHFHLVMILSLLAVLITYFGSNYFMTGLHSYVE